MTPEEIKARIEEAGDTLKRLSVSGCWPHEHRTSWPDYVTEGWWGNTAMDVETGRAADTMVKPSPPSAAKITRLEEVERWVEMVADPYEIARLVEGHGHSAREAEWLCHTRARILSYRVFGYARDHRPMTWREIGRRVRRSHEWARKTYDDTLERIASRLSMGILRAPRGMMEEG